MTRVTIDPGICGFATNVEVREVGRRKVSVLLSSGCEMVESMNGRLKEVGWLEALAPPADSMVWQCAHKSLRHPCCSVPIGILKAIEVELDLALPKDVVIHFEGPDDLLAQGQ